MIRIVIAEEQELLLEALGSLLNLEEDVEVVGRARTGTEVITLVRQMRPDVCIMDIDMPEKNGLEVAEDLSDIDCKMMILTTFARQGYDQEILKAGVFGYLLKDSPSEKLTDSIRSVIAGNRIYEPELLDEVNSDHSFNIEQESITDITLHQQDITGPFKTYITTIMEKIKLPIA